MEECTACLCGAFVFGVNDTIRHRMTDEHKSFEIFMDICIEYHVANKDVASENKIIDAQQLLVSSWDRFQQVPAKFCVIIKH